MAQGLAFQATCSAIHFDTCSNAACMLSQASIVFSRFETLTCAHCNNVCGVVQVKKQKEDKQTGPAQQPARPPVVQQQASQSCQSCACISLLLQLLHSCHEGHGKIGFEVQPAILTRAPVLAYRCHPVPHCC